MKASRRPKRTMQERRVETTNKILDAAERLFGLRGLYGVTVRDVARDAEVDNSLINYYFGDKDGLFQAVIDRRAASGNQARLAALDEYERVAGSNLSLEGAFDAFLQPAFTLFMHGEPGWRHFGGIIGHMNNAQEWGGRVMSEHFNPVSERLIALMRKILPHAADEDIYWCYHFLSGAFTFSLAQAGRIDILSGGRFQSTDMEAIHKRLAPLFAAGVEAVCGNPAHTSLRTLHERPNTVQDTPAAPRGRTPSPTDLPSAGQRVVSAR